MKALAAPLVVTVLLVACSPQQDPPTPPANQAVAPPAAAVEVPPAPVTPPAEAPPSPRSASPARLPVFNATCGNGTEVHANEGGPVFLNGQQASLKKFNDNYFEASHEGQTVSISFRPDGSLSLSFSGPGRTNGICTLK